MNEQTEIHAPKIKVVVTQEIIDSACRADVTRCMIAEAVKDAVPDAKNVLVDLTSIRWSDPEKGLRYVYIMPPLPQTALIRFDKGEKIPPFSFRLRNAHISSMMIGGRGNEKRAHNLGPRRHVRTAKEVKEGAVGDVIGGTRRVPTATLGKGRVYGNRAYVSLFEEDANKEITEQEFQQRVKGYVSRRGARKSKQQTDLEL